MNLVLCVWIKFVSRITGVCYRQITQYKFSFVCVCVCVLDQFILFMTYLSLCITLLGCLHFKHHIALAIIFERSNLCYCFVFITSSYFFTWTVGNLSSLNKNTVL